MRKVKRFAAIVLIALICVNLSTSFLVSGKTAGKNPAEVIENVVVFAYFKNEVDNNGKSWKDLFNERYDNDPGYGQYSLRKAIDGSNNGNNQLLSLKEYVDTVSYGQAEVRNFFPQEDGNRKLTGLVTLDLNPQTLAKENNDLAVLKQVEEQIPDLGACDINKDGIIDNLTVILGTNSKGDSGSSLIGHMFSYKTQMRDVTVSKCNFVATSSINGSDTSVIYHEFMHTLDFQDMYAYDTTSTQWNPVGVLDIMGQSNQAWPLAYLRYERGWIEAPEVIDETRTQLELNPQTERNGVQAYVIKSPLNPDEIFVVEYREKGSLDNRRTLDAYLAHSGIVVYRVNTTFARDSKHNKLKDKPYVYIFGNRDTDNGTRTCPLVDGQSIGTKNLDDTQVQNTLFYADGKNSGIVIDNIKTAGKKVTFDVYIPGYDPNISWRDTKLSQSQYKGETTASMTSKGEELYAAIASDGSLELRKNVGGVWQALGTFDLGIKDINLFTHKDKVYVIGKNRATNKLFISRWDDTAWTSLLVDGPTADQASDKGYDYVVSGDKVYLNVLNGSSFLLYEIAGLSENATWVEKSSKTFDLKPWQVLASPKIATVGDDVYMALRQSGTVLIYKYSRGADLEEIKGISSGGANTLDMTERNGKLYFAIREVGTDRLFSIEMYDTGREEIEKSDTGKNEGFPIFADFTDTLYVLTSDSSTSFVNAYIVDESTKDVTAEGGRVDGGATPVDFVYHNGKLYAMISKSAADGVNILVKEKNASVVSTPQQPKTYQIAVTSGTATVDGKTVTEAAENTVVSVKAKVPKAGMKFKEWVSKGAGQVAFADKSSDTTTFVMPAGDVSVEATYENIPETQPKTYAITVISGTATVDGKAVSEAAEKTVVSVKAKAPVTGMKFKEWISTGAAVTFAEKTSEETTFVMPAGDVSVEATYENIPETQPKTYAITVISGTATVDGKAVSEAAEKTVVSVKAKAPATGMKFKEWISTGAAVTFAEKTSEETTFVMPAGDVSVEATYENIPETQPKTYAITVISGTATVDNKAVLEAAEKTVVSVKAKAPATGMKFKEWISTGAAVTFAEKTSEETTFVMPAGDVSVEATYENIPETQPKTYAITVTSGKATVDGKAVSIAGPKAVITIKAEAPKEGMKFKEWVSKGAGQVTFADKNSDTTTFVMPVGDVSVEATYENIPETQPKTYAITVTSGTATVDGKAVSEATEKTVVSVKAKVPKAGMRFKEWVSKGAGQVAFADKSSDTTTFVMPAGDVSVEATYENIPETQPKTYAITVTSGTATVDNKAVSEAAEKTVVSVKAKAPATGMKFKEWISTGAAVTFAEKTSEETTFVMPAGDVSVEATYENIPETQPKTYAITVTSGKATVDGKAVSIAGPKAVITIKAEAPKEGMKFKEWVSKGAGQVTFADKNSDTTTFVMPVGDVSVEATYENIPETQPKTYAITVTSGTATVDGKAVSEATEKTVVSVKAKVPKAGMRFKEWVSKGAGQVAFADKSSDTTTFVMPAGDVSVEATYENIPETQPKTYAITVISGTATVDNKAVSEAAEKTVVSVKAKAPATGMKFKEWISTGAAVTFAEKTSEETTFVMPAGDVSVEATYENIPETQPKTYAITVTSGKATVDGKAVSIAGPKAVITIKAEAPKEGMKFKEWVSKGAGQVTFADKNSDTTTFVMPVGDVSVEATYENIPETQPKTYAITVTSGTATVDGKAVSEATEKTVVSVKAKVPKAGMRFKEWVSKGAGQVAFADKSSDTTTFVMPAGDVSVEATYENIPETQPKTYAITVISGTATVDGKAVSEAAEKTVVSVKAKAPVTGMKFKEWISTGAAVTFAEKTSEETTFVMPAGDVSVEATYENIPETQPKTYAITVTSGTATVDNKAVSEAAEKTVVSVKAKAPATGMKFKEWISTGAAVTFAEKTSEETTFVMPAGDVSVEATYENIPETQPKTYAITVISGTATVDGKAVSIAGPKAVITIKAEAPKEGMKFKEWVSKGAGQVTFADKNSDTTTFVMPVGDVSVEATYENIPETQPKTYAITVTSGTATVDGKTVTEAAENTVVSVKAKVPKAGMKFKEWVSKGAGQATFADKSSDTTTFVMPAGEVSVEATYENIPDKFAAVAGIDMTNAKSVEAGKSLILAGKVVPSNATNKEIRWSIADKGTTGATLNDNVLYAATAGTVRVTATVENGVTEKTAFSADFTITVTETARQYSFELEGNRKWNKDLSDGLTFKANGELNDLKQVLVDGFELETDDYTTERGSTIIKLKANYLKTLKPGKHTIEAVYIDGNCITKFEVMGSGEGATTPTTPTTSDKAGNASTVTTDKTSTGNAGSGNTDAVNPNTSKTGNAAGEQAAQDTALSDAGKAGEGSNGQTSGSNKIPKSGEEAEFVLIYIFFATLSLLGGTIALRKHLMSK